MNGAYVVKYQPHKARTELGPWIIGNRNSGTVAGRYATREEAEAECREVYESLERARAILAGPAR